jgi:hypothetical protein
MNLESLICIKQLGVTHIEAICKKHPKGRAMRVIAEQDGDTVSSMNILTSERCDQYHAFVAGAEAALAVINEILAKKELDASSSFTSSDNTVVTFKVDGDQT